MPRQRRQTNVHPRREGIPSGRRRPTPLLISPRTRWVLVGAGIVALFLLLRAAPEVLAVALGGFTLALVLSFPVRFLAHFMPRGLAILTTFLLLSGVFSLACCCSCRC